MTRYVCTLLTTIVVALAVLEPGRSIVRAQATQTFRTRVDLVQIDVVVLDQQRRPVTGLTAAEFTILEDGEPRAVEAFAAITLRSPVVTTGAAWTREIAPDVVSNQRANEGRLVVILMDRSIPAGPATVTARAIARSAVDALGENDLAVVATSTGFGNEGRSQNFTRDRARLMAAIDSPFMGLVAPPSMTPAGLVTTPPNLFTTGDCLCGSCATDALERAGEALAAERTRQKTLLFIGSNILIQWKPGDPDMCNLPITDGRERALRALDRANVTVHSIDPSGLETLAGGADAFPEDPRGTSQRMLERQGNLGVFPDYTGGRTVLNANQPESLVPAIFSESQSYYLLGFQRGTDERAGSRNSDRRSIRVRVNREGVTVRSRTGYYPPTPTAPGVAADPATAALAEVLPNAGMSIALGLTPRFRSDGTPQASVVLGIAEGTSEAARKFDVRIAVFDDKARPVGSERQTVEAPASSTGDDIVESHSSLPLGPGRYEIRVGVSDSASGKSGSVFGYVDVPPPTDAPWSLSGILLESRSASSSTAFRPAPAPTLRRTFSTTDLVTALVQVHHRDVAGSPVVIRARVVDTGGRDVTESTRTLDASSFNAGGVADVRLDVPTGGLPAGRYLLTVEATGVDRSEKRNIPFALE